MPSNSRGKVLWVMASNISLQVTFAPPRTFASAKAHVAANAPELRRYMDKSLSLTAASALIALSLSGCKGTSIDGDLLDQEEVRWNRAVEQYLGAGVIAADAAAWVRAHSLSNTVTEERILATLAYIPDSGWACSHWSINLSVEFSEGQVVSSAVTKRGMCL